MRVIMAMILSVIVAACGETRGPAADPAGAEESTKTNVLEVGATALQADAPVGEMDIYVVGFHPMKEDPSQQMEAHHFCDQVNEDLAQCVLFDGNTGSANLNGIEYIISERLFGELPQDERQYWHPHNGEILSGQLVAPGLPGLAEEELMKSKMNSYGKTWHTWSTGENARLPLGEPMLAWSFNRDGEARPDMVKRRDRAMDIDSAKIRQNRADLRSLANFQEGTNTLDGKFGRDTSPIPGVVYQPSTRQRQTAAPPENGKR